ncbi:MAG: GMC family oxidoreductase [Mesorhizobium sp.]|nr:GMC family oxidoreductase [Mesorhizobium sp.]MBL8575696.1 GMC family oxidoreductase [Mesorhizobium sp.]
MSHYDLAIVGGGSAGALLAARLSEDEARRVVLIEAGGEPDDPDIAKPAAWPALQGRDYDWDYRTEPQPGTAGRIHHWARGRAIGGSSLLHAMGHMRGHPADFADWVEATGDQRWSWDGLLPAFMAIEDHSLGGDGIHGKGGPLPVWLPGEEVSPVARAYIEAGAALGLRRIRGHNTGEMVGVTPNSLTIRGGRRVTVAEAWLTPTVRARKNLTILTGCLVRRLKLEGGRVAALEAVGPEGPVEITADEIILSAGSIESPALLMRSGIGPEDVLAAAGVACKIAAPDVGRNLRDHLLGAGNLYAARQTVPASRLQHSESMAYMRAGDFSATGRPEIVVGCGVAPIVSERFTAPAAGTAYSFLFGVTNPTSRGSLKITGPEPGDRVSIDPCYLQTENDRRLVRAALAAAREIGKRPELDNWRERELLPGSLETTADMDRFIAEAAITHHHPSGTCRMGKDEASVVDPALKLRGVDNVHVVDGSVIPSLTAGPIHAAVLAIAETFARDIYPGDSRSENFG